MSESIIAAAIQRGPVIFTGTRHGLIIQQMVDVGFVRELPKDRVMSAEQGFLTSDGRFVSRAEGMQIAVGSGQLEYKEQFPELFSEDLW